MANKVSAGELFRQVLGSTLANQLMRAKGLAGCQIAIPKGRTERSGKIGQLLTDAIGIEGAEKVISHFGGEVIYIPKDFATKLMVRNQEIVQEYNSGMSILDIASKHDLSDRRVQIILKKTDIGTAH